MSKENIFTDKQGIQWKYKKIDPKPEYSMFVIEVENGLEVWPVDKYDIKGTITIPESIDGIHVDKIGNNAFSGCTELKEVIFPDSDKKIEIGESAFEGCTGLTKLRFPYAVEIIRDNAFKNCSNLDKVTFYQLSTYVAPTAFFGCNKVDGFYYVDDLDRSDKYYEGKDGILWKYQEEDGGIKASIDVLGTSDVYKPHNPEDMKYTLVIPSSIDGKPVTVIGDRDGLSSDGIIPDITQVVIPDTVIELEAHSFCGFVDLESVKLPESLQIIGTGAFAKCTSLKEINIPDSVNVIGEMAFLTCTELSKVSIGKNVEDIDDLAFIECKKIKEFNVDPDNINYESLNGDLYNKGCTTLIQYAIGKDEKSFKTPDSVKEIKNLAFAYSNLQSVTISEPVEKLGYRVFVANKNLTSVELPKTLKSVDSAPFFKCDNLEKVVAPKSMSVDFKNLFKGCKKIEERNKIIEVLKTLSPEVFSTILKETIRDNPSFRDVIDEISKKPEKRTREDKDLERKDR